MKKAIAALAIILTLTLTGGCASAPRNDAAPFQSTLQKQIDENRAAYNRTPEERAIADAAREAKEEATRIAEANLFTEIRKRVAAEQAAKDKAFDKTRAKRERNIARKNERRAFEKTANQIDKSGCLTPVVMAAGSDYICKNLLKQATIIEWVAMENYNADYMKDAMYRLSLHLLLARNRQLYRAMDVSPKLTDEYVASLVEQMTTQSLITNRAVAVHNGLAFKMETAGADITEWYRP